VQRSVQRRLAPSTIDRLVADYQAGRSLSDLAAELGIHKRTAVADLQRQGISRRVNGPKVTRADVERAARRERSGESLVTVGAALGAHLATIRRELAKAGVAILGEAGRHPRPPASRSPPARSPSQAPV